MNDPNDLLRIDGIVVSCIIGIHPEERTTPQPLHVSLGFPLDARRASFDENLDHSIDYARVSGEVGFLLQQGSFHLIETAAEVVSRGLLSGLEHVDEIEVTVAKPQALGGNGLPSLKVHRTRDQAAALWTFAFGVVEVIWNAKGLGVYRLRLRPGAGVKLPKNAVVFDRRSGRNGAVLTPTPPSVVNEKTGPRLFLLVARPPLRLDEFVAV